MGRPETPHLWRRHGQLAFWTAMALLVAVAAWALIAFGGSMRGASTPLAIVIFAALWLLVAGLAPVALALLLSGFVGTVLIMGVPIALTIVGSETVALITSEELAVLPLFLIMGDLATASGMANDLYRFAAAIFGFQRGGLALGSVMDAFTILQVTAPIVSSMIVTLGYDLLWWGIVMVVVIEIGVISPPFGMNLFVMKGVAKDVSLATIYRGVLPFVVADIIKLALLILFPVLSLWLPLMAMRN